MMKKNNSPFYPAYCDDLIEEFGVNMSSTNTVAPQVTIGWGWTEWGEWIEDSCPEECGRRCRVRFFENDVKVELTALLFCA